MSLLVPDYDPSSSDEEAAAPPLPRAPAPLKAAPTPAAASSADAADIASSSGGSGEKKMARKKRKRGAPMKAARKPKTTLFLPPEIQRLLEEGGAASSSDEDGADGEMEESLLQKHKRLAARRPPAPSRQATEEMAGLGFLPAPKHEPEPTESASTVLPQQSEATAEYPQVAPQVPVEYYSQEAAQTSFSAYDQQQYPVYASEDAYDQDIKNSRHRDRDMERLLRQGRFDAVASQLVDVQGPAPNAWQAPVDQLGKGDASDVKVTASFWNASAGASVASVKPSRLQRQRHQLNQLAFDAKVREFDLLDRKGAALKTKRETHAKYGW